jgi:alkanesulfonate monooxygenase SsuD/methylene tetrahydromethanopterin reductase-like flavin-dependent oxidoreductase (luciferase family)
MEVGLIMKVSFGWRIPAFPFDGSDAKSFKIQIIDALDSIERDFDSAWISDHPIPWADWQNPRTTNLEGWTALNYFSALYDTLVFGHIVLCNSYRNPALLAKMATTLNFLTGGRFFLGIGAGWKRDEYISYGYEFPGPSMRIAQLEEAVQIIKLMWTEDTVTFRGKYYNVENAYCDPKPKPIPPIMIGGGGEKLTMKVAARYADFWNCPNLTLEQYKHKLEILKRHCKTVGRSYEEIRKTWLGCIAIAEKERDAMKIALSNPVIKNETRFDPLKATIIGSPEQVVEKLQGFKNLGVDYFIFRFLDFPSIRGSQLFTDHVMDALR